MRRRLSRFFDGFSRNVIVLSFVSFFNDISSESIARILPIFLRETLRVSFTAIGWVEGIADSLSIVLRLVTGFFVDAARHKKPFLVFGYGLSALVRPFFPILIPIFGWPGALALKALDRVGKAVRVVPRDVLIAIESQKGTRGRGFGFNRAMDTFGAFIGIALVAVIARGDANTTIVSSSLFRTVVLVASVSGFLGVALILVGVREKNLKREIVIPSAKVRPQGSLKDLPRSFYFYLSCVCLFSLAGSSDAFLILKLRQSGFSLADTFWLIGGYNLIAAVTVYPVSRFSDFICQRKIPIFLGWLIYAVSYLIFGWTNEAWILGFGFVGYGLYYGFVESTEKALVADLVPTTHLGRAYGLFNFLTGALLLPANLIFGLVSDHWSLETACTLSAVLALFAALILVLVPVGTGSFTIKLK